MTDLEKALAWIEWLEYEISLPKIEVHRKQSFERAKSAVKAMIEEQGEK